MEKLLLSYVNARKAHLREERRKVPYTVSNPKRREVTIRQLAGRIKELDRFIEMADYAEDHDMTFEQELESCTDYAKDKAEWLHRQNAEMVKAHGEQKQEERQG